MLTGEKSWVGKSQEVQKVDALIIHILDYFMEQEKNDMGIQIQLSPSSKINLTNHKINKIH
jgi:hypothetical protein